MPDHKLKGPNMKTRLSAALILGMTLLMVSAFCFTQYKPSRAEDDRLKGSYRFERNGWIYVHLEGSPDKIGYQHGALLAKETEDLLRVLGPFLQHETKQDWNFYRQASQEILWAKIDAESQTEIDGIVRGLNDRGDAVNLGLELRVDLRPKNFLRRLAIEVPIALRLMLQKRPQHAQQVLRLLSQQGTVLIANFVRRAFEVHVNPAVALKAVAPLQTIVLGASRFVLREAKGADHQ